MSIALHVKAVMKQSSLIRQMFENGARLKTLHGAGNVYDFSIGNPDMPPPDAFLKALARTAWTEAPGVHGYMPNAGYPETRKAVADFVSRDQCVDLSAEDVVMTCGAAGGLNVILRSLLNPGEEVIVPRPYFPEYDFYVANAGGSLRKVPARTDFTLSIEDIAGAITQKTRIVLINSPNNPTGQIYPEENLKDLGTLLQKASRDLGKTLYLVSDESYRRIVYDGFPVPSILHCYKQSLLTSSFSKDLSIPGERIGYIAVHPRATEREDILDALTLSNRTLGFVNAPALMQRILPAAIETGADMQAYTRKRDLLCQGMAACGYGFTPPAGAFYLFPKSPVEDDRAFVAVLAEQRIIAVPGTVFGCPGHFRLAFCVSDETITKAIPGFSKAYLQFA